MDFPYGETEIAYLRARDLKLGAAMERIGPIHREVDPDLFSSVIHHIIGQQVVRRGAKHAGPSTGRMQPFEHRRIVGQRGGVDRNPRGDLAFQRGLARQQPPWQQECVERIDPQQGQQ